MRRRTIFPCFEAARYDFVIHGCPEVLDEPSIDFKREQSLTGTQP